MSWFSRRVYLDHASATPVTCRAEYAYTRALRAYGNPSSPHQEGVAAAGILADARRVVARELEAKPDDVMFTGGATEANNIAIMGVVRAAENRGIRPHLLYVPGAHASILEPITALEKRGVAIEPLVITDGAIDLEALSAQLRPETVLVSMERVCGETGVIWDTRGVRRVLDTARPMEEERILLHVDASHAPRIESLERTRLAGDLITFDAQKIGGVRGVGALIASRTLSIEPVFYGGGQERGLSPGTENVAAIAAFAAALTEARTRRASFVSRAKRLRDLVLAGTEKISAVEENRGQEQAPHILNLSCIGRDTDYLVALLDTAGFAVSTRSACETDSTEGSRAVLALTNDVARAASTLRVSFGYETTRRMVRRYLRAFSRSLLFLDSHPL